MHTPSIQQPASPIPSHRPQQERKPSLSEKVYDLAARLFESVVSVGLFLISPTLFCTGLLFSVIRPDLGGYIIDRIETVWTAQSAWSRVALVIGSGLALAYTLSAGALLMGVHVGWHLGDSSSRVLSDAEEF